MLSKDEQGISETIAENTMRERLRKINNIDSFINNEVDRIEKDIEYKKKKLEIKAYDIANVEEHPYCGRIDTHQLDRIALDLTILLEKKKFIVGVKERIGL
jgi:hypothetical protein|nr:MAG TPA: hypothetical protein [Caudoviricetes sp.]